MDPLPGNHTCYWAPEVTYLNGRFYMYYSVGNEVNMQIRVALADRPDGPFVDSGRRLTQEKFAIDAHIFTDDDGASYLFYATDYLDHERIGTGTAVDRLVDPLTAAGSPRPVTRAAYEWQVYDPQRAEKGGVRWYTLEGPFVLKHNGRYYEMFGAGNWHNATYGVSYAVTDSLARPDEWRQYCDGEQVMPILGTRPELGVIGPGHNSVVRGPDNCELFSVYHRWQPETQEQVLAMDRLGWEDDRLVVYGPSATPQPAPRQPEISGFSAVRPISGKWTVTGNAATLAPEDGPGSVELALPGEECVLEISLRAAGVAGSDNSAGAPGFSLIGDGGEALAFTLDFDDGQVEVTSGDNCVRLSLPPGFDPYSYHLLRVEAHGASVALGLDGPGVLRWRGDAVAPCKGIAFHANGRPCVLAGLAVTAFRPGC
jgi:GH43 family beta-xylosidase